MLEFKEVTYLYRLFDTSSERVEEINTTEGYAHIDYGKGFCWPLVTAASGVPTIPWNFLKAGSTLYIMKKEPNYYV